MVWRFTRGALISLGLLMFATPAHADALVFAGALASGNGARLITGASIGFFFPALGSIGGWEVEYARTRGGARSPRIDTFGASLLVQSLRNADGLQFYGALGGGSYSRDEAGTVFQANVGGGLKVRLAGPLRLRFDYRLYILQRSDAGEFFTEHRHPQRASAGIGLGF